MSDSANVWRAAGAMGAGTAMSRVTGLIRVAAITYALGITGTRLADTYNLANTTPNIVYEVFLGGILTSVFVPVLIGARERREGDASALISVSLLALAVVSAFAAIGAPLIMRAYTFRVADPQARAAQLELATFLLRWFAPQIFFYGVSAVATALLNVRGRFAAPAFAPVLNNVVVAGTMIAFARVISEQGLELSTTAKVVLGAGTTAGVVVQALVLLPFLRGEQLRFRVDPRDPAVRRVFRLATFVIGYVAINQIGLWAVLALANGERGGVTSWQVAFTFFQLPHGLFAVSLLSVLLPELSRAAASGDWSSFRAQIHTGIRGVAYLLIPAAIGYAILAHPIARLILARGVADARDAAAVASVLQVFAVGLVFYATFQLLTRAFYALSDSRTPAMLNAIAVASMIAIGIPLFPRFGVRGLAAGHATSYAIGTLLLMRALNRRVPEGLKLVPLGATVVRMLASAVVMGAAVWGLVQILPDEDVLVVVACVAAGALLYLGCTKVLGAPEPALLLGLIRRRRAPDVR